MSDTGDYARYDDTIGLIREKWKDDHEIFTLAKQMEVLGKNMNHLRGSKETEDRKKLRIVWQKAIQQYWDLLWAIVEAKIDEGPPDSLEFDPAERLFIDFGHLGSGYTTPNGAFFEQLGEEAPVDMYQYHRLTDYLKENYALIFGKPYTGTSSGVSIEEKQARFAAELNGAQTRRRMVMGTLFAKFDLASKQELDDLLTNLEEGLRDAVESDMRTRRIREADEGERKIIKEHCRKYEVAERTLWYLMDQLERKLTKADEKEKKEIPAAAAEPAAPGVPEEPPKVEEDFDPFAEIGGAGRPIREPEPVAETFVSEAGDEEAFEDSEETAESLAEKASVADQKEVVDQSLKIIQNILSLHDRTRFLASMIVHVTNEADRWKMRVELATKKYKGQGFPALKLELREGLNNKKDFMMLCARQARVDASPLCQNKGKPISLKRAGEIMMDLTPLDPDMLRASRIRMYGIPRVILVPGQGFGVYDWSDNSLLIPIFGVVSDVKAFCFALAAFRWDNDEDRTLKDTFALLKQNKGKGIRGLQEQFSNDYFLWISKERKGYRILARDVSKWFKTFFKQKSGTGTEKSPGMR